MKTAEEWNWEHTKICANDPAVHGQLLPSPQMIRFIQRIQSDAIKSAALIADDMGDKIGHGFGELTDHEMHSQEACYNVGKRLSDESDAVNPQLCAQRKTRNDENPISP